MGSYRPNHSRGSGEFALKRKSQTRIYIMYIWAAKNPFESSGSISVQSSEIIDFFFLKQKCGRVMQLLFIITPVIKGDERSAELASATLSRKHRKYLPKRTWKSHTISNFKLTRDTMKIIIAFSLLKNIRDYNKRFLFRILVSLDKSVNYFGKLSLLLLLRCYFRSLR